MEKLTRNETELMEVFWNSKMPLTKSDLIHLPLLHNWKDSSVYILINSLMKKNVLCVVGSRLTGKTYGRIFSPAMSREEFYARTLIDNSRINQQQLICRLIQNPELTQQDLRQIKKILNEQQTEKEGV